MTFKKLAGKIHLWLGLASGLAVFTLGITGAAFVFEKELKDIFYHDRIFVDSKKQTTVSFDTLMAVAQKTLGADKPINRVEIKPGSNRTFIFSAYKTRAEAFTYNTQYVYSEIIYINPYTGKVEYAGSEKWEFFRMILTLHYDLMLGKAGHIIVLWSCAIFVLMLITGIILWWPRNKAAVRHRTWFRWKKKASWKRKNYDLHNIPGFYVLFIVLFISLTGLVFGFRWFSNGVKSVVNTGTKKETAKPFFSDTPFIGQQPNYKNILLTLQQEQPHIEKFLLVLPDKKDGAISVRCYHNPKNFVKQNILFFDRYQGTLLGIKNYDSLSRGDKVIMANYDIHTGKVLGLPGQLLALLGALVSASLPVTGFLIWWGRQRKNTKRLL